MLVRVRAGSLNYRDLLLAKGQYNPKLAFPRVLGSDAAGEVVAVGPGVTQWKPGDRVANTFLPNWADGPITDAAAKPTYGSDTDGVFAELIAVRYADFNLVPLPEAIDDVTGAALGCRLATAYRAVALVGRAAAGQ